MRKFKILSLIVLITGYLIAGSNHFLNPKSYIKIIPPYLPFKSMLNIVAGVCELLFAILLIFKRTREFAAWGIIFMLIAFIPVHTKMVRDAPFWLGSFTVTPLIAWVRLVVLQPLLIWWAYIYTRPQGEF